MSSIRHNTEDRYLDAARENILAVGWRRTTLTDVAKRAGASRMTIYRRWPDTQTLLADLLVREWTAVVEEALGSGDGLAVRVAATISALREEPLFRRIV